MEWLESIHGEISIISGKLQYYLGMTLCFCTQGYIIVTIVDYIKGVLEDFLEVITGRSTKPAGGQPFQVRPEDDKKLLDKGQATEFYHIVAQLLFVAPRAIKDINMVVSLLCTQVRILDKDD